MTPDDAKKMKAKAIIKRTLDSTMSASETDEPKPSEDVSPTPQPTGTHELKLHALELMKKELRESNPDLDEERLETIRKRMESGYYKSDNNQSAVISRILDDLLGTDPFDTPA
ncbi:MAG: hypothetical protein HKN43_09990 [Rhodothermales bacterium]|nr:hypothetical protein [Rhodothermales bacterium]